MRHHQKEKSRAYWKFYIDTGGTFTDCLATGPDGGEQRCKVLSSSALRGTATGGRKTNEVQIEIQHELPDDFFRGYRFLLLDEPESVYNITGFDGDSSTIFLGEKIKRDVRAGHSFEIRSPEEAPVLAVRIITKTPLAQPLPPIQMRLSTTKGTNALLERGGAKALFLVTEGFGSLLQIKNQQRPELFALDIQKSEPFYHQIVEVPERIDSRGKIIKPLGKQVLEQRIKPFLGEIDSVGICLMNSYINPAHERQIGEMLKELGVRFISTSSDLSPEIKIVPRAITTDVNAYLAPIMEEYLSRISKDIKGQFLWIMNSGGHLVEAKHYRPKDGLLSGPAGGVTGAAAIGRQNGHEKIISFDMGGTSTDVARFDGEIDYVYEHKVGDATLHSPAVDIETVAAGGGSICGFDGESLTVGPQSAGADPGPACYGRGGPLAITDVNLLSGRLHPANFQISIDIKAAERRLDEISEKTNGLSRRQILEGFLDIANERMAQAIRKISVQKGFGPDEYTLVAFGGAGAQHAMAIAQKLNMQTVIVPPDAGILSAYGLREARMGQISVRQILKPLEKVRPKLPAWFDGLISEAKNGLSKQGVPEGQAEITGKYIFMRFKGQDSSLEINFPDGGENEIDGKFREEYESQYGHWIENREIEVESIRVKVSEKASKICAGDKFEGKVSKSISGRQSAGSPAGEKSSFGEIFTRENLDSGTRLSVPVLILDPHSTTVVEPGWEGGLLENGTWIFKKAEGHLSSENSKQNRPRSVNLQLYTNRFRSVAGQMGEMLRKTSMSVNVKERLDFSCALLDADGYLAVNAPHIPVHLGAMGTCVRALIEKNLQGFRNLGGLRKEFKEGDIIVTNHPAYGGSHLPDVTVVTPVFYDGKRIGFTASRAHHAEIGGKRPGSMPPDAGSLAEEGVVIPPTFIARGGKFNWETINGLLRYGKWPSRSPEENMADIQAAVAANHRGAIELKNLAKKHGVSEVVHYMEKLKTYASGRMRAALRKIDDGEYQAVEKLDDGTVLAVTCYVEGEVMDIDFSGTSGVHPGNLNANPSIVNSVVMYVLRLIVNEPLPLNDGLLEPVKLHIPSGMLNPDFPGNYEECPAVVGGNIETSQRLVDTLLKAFKLAACSYGTMNNVLFGNESFGYYETIGGGTGAGNGFDGADAVHQHMTNTRATDPEILEYRYPVRLSRYKIRKHSGGSGKWKGGNGIIRELIFLEPVSLSVLSQHRVVPPYGLVGGQAGKTGNQWIVKSDGTKIMLHWRDGAELQENDRFIIKTPGGGGYG